MTLLRRLSFDLIGLPPTIEEADRVLADAAANWYGRLIERLLASPHYGERWARHWLDVAQYADSDGFEKDKPRQVWAWRDWVINAFNTDMPYDQFIVEQIAGDMLPGTAQAGRIATGFLRNSMINEEGGIDPEQFRMEALFNRMDVIGRAVLGVTVGCAQCHDHKYDPFTQTEYYRMLAFLNNAHEASLAIYSPSERKQQAGIRALIEEIEDDAKARRPDWRAEMTAWEKLLNASPQPEWHTLRFTFDDTSAGGQRFTPQSDGSYIAQGYSPTQFQPKMEAEAPIPRITAVRLELLPDPTLPRGGSGRSIHGTSALSEFELRVAAGDSSIESFDKWTPVRIASAVADVNPPVRDLGPEFPDKGKQDRVTGPIEMAIDGKTETAWSTDDGPGRRNQARYALFTLREPLELEPGMRLAIRLVQLHGGSNSNDNQTNNLGRFRISVTGAAGPFEEAVPTHVKAAATIPPGQRTEAEDRLVFKYWRTLVPEFKGANVRIEALWEAHPVGGTQLAMLERRAPRVTHRLVRGDFLHPAERVTPGTPAFLHPLSTNETKGTRREDENQPDRLDFARWLASRESPTTARSFVNRVWQRYFGQGIVSTSSDLGAQGELPTHPELLDWLAVEFMDSGWRIKDLHRLIVTSATYRQTSAASPALRQRDPGNRLLARGARFRVEGEVVRDIALAASGLLNPSVGGPSVYPIVPEYLYLPPASYGAKIWRTEKGSQRYRRALYTFRYRSVPYPVLQVFDTPAGNAPCSRRERSNTPLQALTTLNEPLFFECAIALARKTLHEGGHTDRSRIEYAFRRCVTRRPNEEELDTLLRFLAKQRERLADGELDAAQLVASDIHDTGAKDAEAAEDLAAWTLAARVLLNLDETIMRQ